MEHNIVRRRKPFFMACNEIIDMQGISTYAKLLYLTLCRYGDSEGQSFPSRKVLAQNMACSTKAVDRAMHELINMGWVMKLVRFDSNRQTTNIYTIHDYLQAEHKEMPENTGFASSGGETHSPPPRDSQSPPQGLTVPPGGDSQSHHKKDLQEKDLLRERVGALPPSGYAAPTPAKKQKRRGEKTAKPEAQVILERAIYGEHGMVRMAVEDYHRLLNAHGEEVVAEYIMRLDEYIAGTGKQYKNHYAMIKRWIREDKPKAYPVQPVTRFHNFQQRDNDYTQIERYERQQLLQCLNE